MDNIADFVRALVRPIVTVGFTVATIVAAFHDLETAKFLIGPNALILGYWFNERTTRNGR